MIQYTKESLINKLKEIKKSGWILNARQGNSGGVGNTLEDLLGIKENNLPIPNAAEWELKCQRKNTKSLITLMHCEPSPRALKLVPQILLPKYGWIHASLPNELSFRQTITGNRRSDRGFGILINYKKERVEVSFDYKAVNIRHEEWLKSVKERVGNLNEIEPVPLLSRGVMIFCPILSHKSDISFLT